MTLVKLREFAFAADWDDKEQEKFSFYMQSDTVKICTHTDFSYGSPVYFESNKSRFAAVKVVDLVDVAELLTHGVL